MIVVATEEERIPAKKRFKHQLIIKTGVGGLNIIHKLRHIPRWHRIINFGYVGSNCIPIGTEVIVGSCSLDHPNCDYISPNYILEEYGVHCYTSNDFVLESDVVNPCIYDMELAYIMALGFKKVKSIKIVSDNLSLKQYEEEIR